MFNISHLLVISNVAAGWKLIMGREDAKNDSSDPMSGEGLGINFTSYPTWQRTPWLTLPQMALFLPS